MAPSPAEVLHLGSSTDLGFGSGGQVQGGGSALGSTAAAHEKHSGILGALPGETVVIGDGLRVTYAPQVLSRVRAGTAVGTASRTANVATL